MDVVLFLGFTIAYLALFAWALVLVVRRGRPRVSDLALLVLLGLVYDNAVLGLGSFIGEGTPLETANGARFWLHALLTPLLVLVAWDMMRRAGVRWARTRWAGVAAMVVTVALMAYEIAVGAIPMRLAPERKHGVLSYANENAPDGPPVMVLVVAAALLLAGILLWARTHWPWLAIGTGLMVIGSAIPIRIPSDAATNAFELILLISVVLTIGKQNARGARDEEHGRARRDASAQHAPS